MIAEYQGNIYFASEHKDHISLVTDDPLKKTDGFEPKRDYFIKQVPFDDPDLISIYNLHFWVRYHDNVEENELWLVDEGRYVGIVPNIEEGKVVIDVNHDRKDKTWRQYDKGAASKIINLKDCEEFIIEKIFYKKNGSKFNAVEKSKVNLETFKNTMITYRDENL